MSSPVLLRVWAQFAHNDYIGAAHSGPQFEGRPTVTHNTVMGLSDICFSTALQTAQKMQLNCGRPIDRDAYGILPKLKLLLDVQVTLCNKSIFV